MARTSSPARSWADRKRYQFEVTYGLYMLNSAEKFVCCTRASVPANPQTDSLDSIIFLLTSMIVIAAVLYLPEHVSIIAGRASFYWHGDAASAGAKVMRWYRTGRAGGDAATQLTAPRSLAEATGAAAVESLAAAAALAAGVVAAGVGAEGGEL
jgi:hypothetical protein